MKIRGLLNGALVAFGAIALGVTVLAGDARAAAVLSFGQADGASPITGTQSGTTTTITATDAPVSVTQIDAALTAPLSAYFDLNLVSTSAAEAISGNLEQHFSGTFSITSGTGGSGTNYLSGSVIDVAFGAGREFNLSATTPPAGAVTYTSDVIALAELGLDRGAGFSFADVSPALSIDNGTFASFTSSVSGTLSANISTVAEPASLALLGGGLFGLGMLRRRARAAFRA